MNLSIKIKCIDIVVIGFALALTIVFSLLIYIPGSSKVEFLIEAPEQSWVYPNNAETLVEIEGAIGVSVAEIHGGSIRIISSPCANQTCVAAGDISREGQWIACLPNQVFIHVEGRNESDDNGIDGATW
jgi:hypothetical protein